MIRYPLVAAALALSMTFNDQTIRQKVQFADLDISTNAGAQRLASRIQHAAEDVCSSLPMSRQDYGFRGCEHDLASRAADQLRSAKVALALGVPSTKVAGR
jgi:UrcA family protein